MKKTLIILIILVLAILAGWFILRDSEAPVVETSLSGSPFGSGDDAFQTPNSSDSMTDNEQTIPDEFASQNTNLFRISDAPVAGAVVLSRGGETFIRYVDRATGHIYEINPATLTKTKITNQTLPKIYEAYFRPDGNAVLLRYLKDSSDTVENLSLVLTPPLSTISTATTSSSQTSLYTTSSTLIRGDIGSVAVGSGNTLFYSLKDTSSIVTSAFNGSGLRTLLNSPFTNWGLSASGNNLMLYTKASSNAPGYAYTLNISGGGLSKILGPLNALVITQNTAGNRVLYSHIEDNETKLFAKNLSTGAISEILPATLAEKCIWSARSAAKVYCGVPNSDIEANEPDNWYRGATHFSDRLWLFDTSVDIAQVLVEPKSSLGIDIDVYQPKLPPNEDYLIFINRNDLSLWSMKLE